MRHMLDFRHVDVAAVAMLRGAAASRYGSMISLLITPRLPPSIEAFAIYFHCFMLPRVMFYTAPLAQLMPLRHSVAVCRAVSAMRLGRCLHTRRAGWLARRCRERHALPVSPCRASASFRHGRHIFRGLRCMPLIILRFDADCWL